MNPGPLGTRASAAALCAFLIACHSGEPRGTEEPVDPMVGMWRARDQADALVLFSTLGEYRAVGLQIVGLTYGHWRRYSERDIVLETETGSAYTVNAAFEAGRDRVTLSWASVLVPDIVVPVSNEVVLFRTSFWDAIDGGDGVGPP